MEWMLGFRLGGAALSIDPCIPRHWPGYSMRFRYHSAVYDITVENPHRVSRGVTLAELDGMPLISRDHIPLAKDGGHHIRVVLG
jgi:cyclic beta-1,2-glucan synthetase